MNRAAHMISGYSTVETVMAIGVLGVTVTTSLQLNEYAHRIHIRAIDTLKALTIAQSALERIRSDDSTFRNETIQVDQQFTEILQWSRLGSGYQVTVSVEWKSDLGMQKVEIDSYVP